MGYTFRMQDDFSSIPGLMIWVDSELCTKVFFSNGIHIARFNEFSSNQFTYQRLGSGFAKMTVDNWFDMTQYADSGGNPPQFDIINADYSKFKFFHDGSPYLFYMLQKSVIIPGDSGPNCSPSSTGSSINGRATLYQPDATIQGRINNYATRAFDASTQIQNTGIVINNMKLFNGDPILFHHKCYGDGSGFGITENNVYVDGIRQGGGNYTAIGVNNPDRRCIIKMTGPVSATFKNAIRFMLVYDMTGIAPSIIDVYDAKVLQLIKNFYGYNDITF